jgi:hypothetical protein
MKRRLAKLVDLSAFLIFAVLAYGVVGFLRGRGAIRALWKCLVPERYIE